MILSKSLTPNKGTEVRKQESGLTSADLSTRTLGQTSGLSLSVE